EVILVVVSAVLVIALPIQTGMLLAIILSFVHCILILARPACPVLLRVPGTTVWWPPNKAQVGERVPGVLVIAPQAPINFTNADHIAKRIQAKIAEAKEPVRLLVIQASAVIELDYTGSQILQKTIRDLREAGVDIALARLSDARAQEDARRSGLIETVGSDRV